MRVAFLGDIYLADANVCPSVDQDVRDLLAGCDHVVANLEGPITERDEPIAKTGPVMRQRRVVLELLQLLGVDVVGLANNHVMDHGVGGLSDTLGHLETCDLAFGGCGLSGPETYAPVRLWSSRERLSLLCGAENGFGCAASLDVQQGYAWLFDPRFEDMIAREAQEADQVVVFCHAGVEHIDRPLPEFRWAYRHLIDLGASAVIAHHPHITQGIEFYHGAPIFYSIGNFCFVKDDQPETWYISQMPVLDITPQQVRLANLYHIRFRMADNLLCVDDSPLAHERTERLASELEGASYDLNVADDVRSLWRSRYAGHYESALNGYIPPISPVKVLWRLRQLLFQRPPIPNPLLLQALLEIESHRWSVARAMRMRVARDGA